MENSDSSKFTSGIKENSNEDTIVPQNNSLDISVTKNSVNPIEPSCDVLETNICANSPVDDNDNKLNYKTNIANKADDLLLKAEKCEPKNNWKIWTDTCYHSRTLSETSQLSDSEELQNTQERDNNNSITTDLGNTPSFKRGVLYSSTPNQLVPPAKRIKTTFDNLSVVEEVNDESNYDPDQSVKTESSEDSCNKTVLHKDELSMFLEFPKQNKIENVQVDAKSDQKNLTIRSIKDMTITYENLADRTIDEVILRDGGIDEEIEAMCKLDTELDREKILEKANNLNVFISTDEDENKDNFNPEWEVMKKLETDEERYKAVRKLWMNLHMPDPKEYLSSFNWRRRNSLESPINNLPPLPSDENAGSSAKKYYCTEVFDVAIDRLVNFYHNRRLGCEFDKGYEHAIMTSVKNQPKERMVGGRKEFLLTLDQLQTCIKEKMHRNQVAKREIEAIHKFYNGLRNHGNQGDLMYLSHREHQDILHVEDIITSYSTWYRD